MYNVKRLNWKMATDTIYADEKSLSQNTVAQVYTHKGGFAKAYLLRDTKGDSVGNSLLDFIHEFGAPSMLTFDGAQNQFGKNTLFMKTLKEYRIPYHVSSPRRPNENPAEGMIREIKRRWYRVMTKKRVPARLWDFFSNGFAKEEI